MVLDCLLIDVEWWSLDLCCPGSWVTSTNEIFSLLQNLTLFIFQTPWGLVSAIKYRLITETRYQGIYWIEVEYSKWSLSNSEKHVCQVLTCFQPLDRLRVNHHWICIQSYSCSKISSRSMQLFPTKDPQRQLLVKQTIETVKTRISNNTNNPIIQ